jgi:hypothetical protein
MDRELVRGAQGCAAEARAGDKDGRTQALECSDAELSAAAGEFEENRDEGLAVIPVPRAWGEPRQKRSARGRHDVVRPLTVEVPRGLARRS